jgi:hypothetical protein
MRSTTSTTSADQIGSDTCSAKGITVDAITEFVVSDADVQTAIPRDKRHKGPVKIKEEPFQGRVELDATWDFSARIPVPHHQFPDSRLPDDLNPMSSKKKTNVNKDSDEGPQK